MTLRLCVLLWPLPGHEADLHRYEDLVLPLLDEHDGRLVAREHVVRGSDAEPVEVQVIEFPSQVAMDAYLEDPRRLALEPDRAAAVARTQILRLA